MGDNLQGALQLGVKVNVIRVSAFAVNGLMAALAGIILLLKSVLCQIQLVMGWK